jgi:hypothetical protein
MFLKVSSQFGDSRHFAENLIISETRTHVPGQWHFYYRYLPNKEIRRIFYEPLFNRSTNQFTWNWSVSLSQCCSETAFTAVVMRLWRVEARSVVIFSISNEEFWKKKNFRYVEKVPKNSPTCLAGANLSHRAIFASIEIFSLN